MIWLCAIIVTPRETTTYQKANTSCRTTVFLVLSFDALSLLLTTARDMYYLAMRSQHSIWFLGPFDVNVCLFWDRLVWRWPCPQFHQSHCGIAQAGQNWCMYKVYPCCYLLWNFVPVATFYAERILDFARHPPQKPSWLCNLLLYINIAALPFLYFRCLPLVFFLFIRTFSCAFLAEYSFE